MTTDLRFPSIEFFERVRDEVNDDPEFARLTQLFDGAILLKIGDFRLWMKWYRGRIIDLHEGPDPLGHTYSLSASEAVWRRVIEMPDTSNRAWAKLFQFGDIATEGDILAATRIMPAQFRFVATIRNIGKETGA